MPGRADDADGRDSGAQDAGRDPGGHPGERLPQGAARLEPRGRLRGADRHPHAPGGVAAASKTGPRPARGSASLACSVPSAGAGDAPASSPAIRSLRCDSGGAQATVKEAVLFSARMRLAESVPTAKVRGPAPLICCHAPHRLCVLSQGAMMGGVLPCWAACGQVSTVSSTQNAAALWVPIRRQPAAALRRRMMWLPATPLWCRAKP